MDNDDCTMAFLDITKTICFIQQWSEKLILRQKQSMISNISISKIHKHEKEVQIDLKWFIIKQSSEPMTVPKRNKVVLSIKKNLTPCQHRS